MNNSHINGGTDVDTGCKCDGMRNCAKKSAKVACAKTKLSNENQESLTPHASWKRENKLLEREWKKHFCRMQVDFGVKFLFFCFQL